MSEPASTHPNQFALLGQRRFAPFFWTQFCGAANDNLFKFAFTVMVTYQLGVSWLPPSMAGLVIGALFILPFLLFSATSGQLTDKWDKTRMFRLVKNLEIAIMLLAAWGFVSANVPVLLGCVFLMGLHSTLFGPVKFAYLPQVLNERELTGGNGMVEMGTFLAILVGTIGAGVMMANDSYATVVAGGVVGTAVLGYLASRWIPRAAAASPQMALDWNIFKQSWVILRMGLGQTPAVSRSIVGNSWFWFVGAIYLTQIPTYAQEWLHGDETAVTLVLTLFSVGIAVGSLLCERLSGRKVEIGLVPFGSFGLTLFGLLWWWHSGDVPAGAQPHDWLALLGMHQAWWILVSIVGLGVFGGFYIVPLYALIQARTAEDQRARVIASNNILNALFMVVSAIFTIVLLSVLKLSIPQLFLVVSLLNVLVNAYIFKIVPEFTMRFLIWMLSHSMYRVQHRDLERIPDEGAALLVCNHVSFVDALLLGGAIRRPIRFVMYYKIYNLPVLNFVFRTAGAIPIAGRNEDQATYDRAFARIAEYLADGELVCIFPEGKLTGDGEIDVFKGGVSRILEETPVPVIPLALQGLWGSFFSRDPAKGFFKRLWSRVTIVAGAAIPVEAAQPEALRELVSRLRGGLR